jgi:hypothetical protein
LWIPDSELVLLEELIAPLLEEYELALLGVSEYEPEFLEMLIMSLLEG